MKLDHLVIFLLYFYCPQDHPHSMVTYASDLSNLNLMEAKFQIQQGQIGPEMTSRILMQGSYNFA